MTARPLMPWRGAYGPYVEYDGPEPGDSTLVPVDRDPSCGTCRTSTPHLHEADAKGGRK